jgi:hypothetical protein
MRRLYTRAVAAVLALLAFAGLQQAQAFDLDWFRTPVGTWTVTTTFDTPGSPAFVFSEVASFGLGGTYVGTFALDRNSANPFAPPPFAVDFGPKFGTWKRKFPGSSQFDLILKEHLFAGALTPTAVYGPFFPGQNVGIATVKGSPTLNPSGDELAGPFTVEFANAQGVAVFAGSGSFKAKRLKP